MSRLDIVEREVHSSRIRRALTFALVCDLHDGAYTPVMDVLAQADAILIVGDLVNRHTGGYQNALRFLHDAPDVAPVFYVLGNHERQLHGREAYWAEARKSRVTVLDNRFERFEGITLGGLSSARTVNASFLADMARQDGFRLLMCHHPEYFERYIRQYPIDLTVSGHAHGGQVRLFGRGLYAPGQGIFPKLTSGFYEGGRLYVSRGMTNSAHAPRLNNPCELTLLHLTPEKESE